MSSVDEYLFLTVRHFTSKLTKYMPNPKEFRHLIQDPDNEPDFYLIRFIAPLPDDAHYGRTLTLDDVLQFCQENGRSEGRVLKQLEAFLPQGLNTVVNVDCSPRG